ncbi:hypothetical protein [uncultured Paraglaciecola sp.]|uniref:hypothetical protein n=1 Tax=uncultured Paraglaciecola sp. TaxID=1765024 RepID=UPI002617F793|nr:hypothetical protein [uncultured Paraglaciecola sp.]
MYAKHLLKTPIIGILLCGQVFADSVVIDDEVGFAKNANVKSAVRNECNLEDKFANFLDQYISDAGMTVVRASSDEAKKVSKRLHVEIDRVHGAGGGGWTGGKMVHAVGKLTENSKVIGSFAVQRTSSGGAFGAFKGTCSLLGRDVKSMARDVSQWITSPSKDARLGEL